MSYIVKAYSSNKINLEPKTIEEEVLQNVITLISTPKYNVPLNRDFGLAQRFVDMSLPTAKAIFISEIFDAIEEYEPRAELVKITFEQDKEMSGKIIPYLEVNIVGDK